MEHSILGIDVASRKLDLCWSSADHNEFITLEYTDAALDTYLGKHPDIRPDGCTIGVESTGEYHLKVVKYFLSKGFTVKVLNPILTKQYTRSTIRGTKTDKTDSELICKMIREGHGDAVTLGALTDREKELLRLAHTLTKNASQLTLRLQSSRRKELNTQDIEAKLEGIIASLKELSKELVAEATEAPTDAETFIDSIPGFAAHLSAVVYHELGDIKRFANPKSLVAFAGLDPKIKQSGARLNTTGRLMKRGSAHLRSALYLAAHTARRYDPELTVYYAKKRAEGRKHTEVLCMIARKLLYRIWAVLREQREYVRRELSTPLTLTQT